MNAILISCIQKLSYSSLSFLSLLIIDHEEQLEHNLTTILGLQNCDVICARQIIFSNVAY